MANRMLVCCTGIIENRQNSVIFDACGGSIRDPHVDYDGRTILLLPARRYRPLSSIRDN